jgi:UDP-N-acetylglucosamine 4,6-dehydratase/5-epimerase
MLTGYVDLIGRIALKMDRLFKDKKILVTGGCGSIGSEIVAQLLEHDPRAVYVLDHDESGQFHLRERMEEKDPEKAQLVRHLVGDIRDKDRLNKAVKGVDIIFHAAALKHVPLCEYNPFEAVATNVIGTENLIDAAIRENVDRFISISTDKAVNPINTMGATKLLSEKLTMTAPIGDSKTLFSCVRFGNVLDSDGSVIPIFRRQIEQGGPVTLTSDDMTRFFMSIKEAVNLVLEAAKIMKGREIFILKMNSVKISDLAEVMIKELAPKCGYKPGDIKIKIIGKRPGEKLYESLLTEEEIPHSEETDNMYIIRPGITTPGYVEKYNQPKELDILEYSSRSTVKLSKEKIREKLYKEQIL